MPDDKLILDMAKRPADPDGFKVVEHQVGSFPLLVWGSRDFGLLLVQMRNGRWPTSYELYFQLAGKERLNAVVLDAMLKWPELIPAGWRQYNCFGNDMTFLFPGTIYQRVSDGELFVRGLKRWREGNWTNAMLWFSGPESLGLDHTAVFFA